MKNNAFKLLLLLVVLFACAFYFHFIWNTSLIYKGTRYFTLLDDAMIGMRYAKNFAAGNGLVYNPGEYVEGFTHFLWAVYMGILHLLPVHESKLPLLMSITSVILIVFNVYYSQKMLKILFHRYLPGVPLNNNLVWIYVVLFIAMNYALLFWSVLGLEVGVICTLLNYIQYRIYYPFENEKRNSIEYSALFVLLFLIRMDTIIYFISVSTLLLVFRVKNWRFFILPAILMGVSIILLTAFRVYYYDDYLPNTYYLKVSIPLKERLYHGVLYMINSLKNYIGLLFAISTLLVILNFRKTKPELWMGYVILFTSMMYNIYVGGDTWETETYVNRFLTTGIVSFSPSLLIILWIALSDLRQFKKIGLMLALIFFLTAIYFLFFYQSTSSQLYLNRFGTAGLLFVIYSMLMVVFAVYFFFKKRAFPQAIWAMALVILLNIWIQVNAYSFLNYYWYRSVNQVMISKRLCIIGLLLRENTEPDTKFGVVLAGGMPYYSDRYCTDLMGKCEKYIAKSNRRREAPYKPGHMKWDYIYSINKYDPEIILRLWMYSPEELSFILSRYNNDNGFFIRKDSKIKFSKEVYDEIIKEIVF